MQQPCFLFPKAPGCPRWQFPTVIFSESLLPLQCPVSAACPPNLVTIHSSLFTKNARYRRPAKAPLVKGGWFGEAKPGGFRGQGHGLIHYSLFTLHLKCPSPFHMGLCLWESACCESLSQKSKIFASSLWQGSHFAPGIVLWCDTGLFQTFNRQRGIKTSPNFTNLKRG